MIKNLRLDLIIVLFVYGCCSQNYYGHHHHQYTRHNYHQPGNKDYDLNPVLRWRNRTHNMYWRLTPSEQDPMTYIPQALPPNTVVPLYTSSGYFIIILPHGRPPTDHSMSPYLYPQNNINQNQYSRYPINTPQQNPQYNTNTVTQQNLAPTNPTPINSETTVLQLDSRTDFPNLLHQDIAPSQNTGFTPPHETHCPYPDKTVQEQNPQRAHPDIAVSKQNPPVFNQGVVPSRNQGFTPPQNTPRLTPDTSLEQQNPQHVHPDVAISNQNPTRLHQGFVPPQNTGSMPRHDTRYPDKTIQQQNPQRVQPDITASNQNPTLLNQGFVYPKNHGSILPLNTPRRYPDTTVQQQNPQRAFPDIAVSKQNPPVFHQSVLPPQNLDSIRPQDTPRLNPDTSVQQHSKHSHPDVTVSKQNPTLLHQGGVPPGNQGFTSSQYAPRIAPETTVQHQNPQRHPDVTVSNQNPTLLYGGFVPPQNQGLAPSQNGPSLTPDTTVHQPNPQHVHPDIPVSNQNPTLLHKSSEYPTNHGFIPPQNIPLLTSDTTVQHQNPQHHPPIIPPRAYPDYNAPHQTSPPLTYPSNTTTPRRNWPVSMTSERPKPVTLAPTPTFAEELFCDLYLIELEQEPYCNNGTKQIFDGPGYIANIPLKGSREDSIEVKIKHRVMSVVATSADGQSQNHLFVLPSFVDTRKAGWRFIDTLRIYFSVKNESICKSNFDDEVRIVRRFANDRYNLISSNLPFF